MLGRDRLADHCQLLDYQEGHVHHLQRQMHFEVARQTYLEVAFHHRRRKLVLLVALDDDHSNYRHSNLALELVEESSALEVLARLPSQKPPPVVARDPEGQLATWQTSLVDLVLGPGLASSLAAEYDHRSTPLVYSLLVDQQQHRSLVVLLNMHVDWPEVGHTQGKNHKYRRRRSHYRSPRILEDIAARQMAGSSGLGGRALAVGHLLFGSELADHVHLHRCMAGWKELHLVLGAAAVAYPQCCFSVEDQSRLVKRYTQNHSHLVYPVVAVLVGGPLLQILDRVHPEVVLELGKIPDQYHGLEGLEEGDCL